MAALDFHNLWLWEMWEGIDMSTDVWVHTQSRILFDLFSLCFSRQVKPLSEMYLMSLIFLPLCTVEMCPGGLWLCVTAQALSVTSCSPSLLIKRLGFPKPIQSDCLFHSVHLHIPSCTWTIYLFIYFILWYCIHMVKIKGLHMLYLYHYFDL